MTEVVNMRLINHVVGKVYSRARLVGVDREDLMQEAAMTYLNCKKTFQKGRGAKFETYATCSMINRLNYLIDQAKQVAKFEEAFVNVNHTVEDFNASHLCHEATDNPLERLFVQSQMGELKVLGLNRRKKFPTIEALVESMVGMGHEPKYVNQLKKELLANYHA